MAVTLSIRQPWVELILLGRKTVEVRGWHTAYHGLLLLHASSTLDFGICDRFGFDPDRLPLGAIVGSVDLVGCTRFTQDTWRSLAAAHLTSQEFTPRLFGWILSNPRRIQPKEFRGRLGLFDVPDHLFGSTAGVPPALEQPRRL